MLKTLYLRLISLNLGLWLITGVMLALAAGSFSQGAAEGGGLNEMPLFAWLLGAPVGFSWWLWIALALLAPLTLNAILCSIEALRKGRSLAPQLMHLGFLFIVLAHLLSAYGGFKQQFQLPEGGSLGFPDGERLLVENISGVAGPMGMLSSYQARMRIGNGAASGVEPNHPLFHKGYGIYLKQVELVPVPVALIEVHREPGAWAALAGALFFTLGNLMLLMQRRGKPQ
ncbi:cytochrome c biogenesis protein ResB [Geomonas limicola]|uniref:Cytochrome c biogenesis protein ResB n=1 Tax=Geomonas limicola TaxID=2740186 RepID=A0A6V8N6A6_9BACT|nr:cytochrome C biogenesis protein ResB [Geomonas limicola]GFO67454.1 cytochrome c biogenesis protein ResB [Geomonas limicola]